MENYVKISIKEYNHLLKLATAKEGDMTKMFEEWDAARKEVTGIKDRYFEIAIKNMNYFEFKKLQKLLKEGE